MLTANDDYAIKVAEPRWSRADDRVRLSDTERAALWRQRLFEAEAGMTRLLAAHAHAELISGWIRTRAEIFAGLPDERHAHADGWQGVFFRAQALMERFLVRHLGHDALHDWAASNSEVYALVERAGEPDARAPITRLAKQAELYGSRYSADAADPGDATLEIEHCAIWDYREKARTRGVQLTLASPCEFCTKATAATIRANGCEAEHELTDGPGGPGCRWRATAPASVTTTPNPTKES
jgi:hypothetical protein